MDEDTVRIKQRTPGEVVAYHDGWRAGFNAAVAKMASALTDARRFGEDAYKLQKQMEGYEARVPYPTPTDGGI